MEKEENGLIKKVNSFPAKRFNGQLMTRKVSREQYDSVKHKDFLKVSSNFESVNALRRFIKLIDHKNAVSYRGEFYSKKDADILYKHFKHFSDWTNNLL